MTISFFSAKNQELCCSLNNINLHSSYNPSREAQRFVDTRQYDFIPAAIIVTEPCLSYCASFFRQKFPKSLLICIRYVHDFYKYDYLWDKVFYLDKEKSLSESLFNYLGEEKLLKTLFLSWTPGEKPFYNEYLICWNEIKKSVQKSQSVLVTRSYFAKRWLKNIIKFCRTVNKTTTPLVTDKPVIVCASGRSLESSISCIKKYRQHFYLLCVSSAISVLSDNAITPDLYLSTDGGYWAKVHLSHHIENNTQVPIALSPESAVYSHILDSHTIVPIFYGDGLSQDFYELFPDKMNAYRNGTVSGTALQLALELTSNKVYLCGLDLSSNKGYPHSQPNEIEVFSCTRDDRLHTLETRITPSVFHSASLNIYLDWFNNLDNKEGRIRRLSQNYNYSNKLTNIKDVDWRYFEQNISSNASHSDNLYSKINKVCIKNKDIKNIIQNNIDSQRWLRELFPLEYILFDRCSDNNEKQKIKEMLTSKANAIKEELLNDL